MAVKQGDVVKIVCTGKLDDGRVIYSNSKEQPLEFRVGSRTILPGIEEGVIGMETEEKKELTIPPEKGFGYPKAELVKICDKRAFSDTALQKGKTYQIKDPKAGVVTTGIVTEIGRDTVTLDFNNPFCGKTVTFEVEVLEIVRAA